MLPKILIIIGVLLIIGGIFGLLTIFVQPILRAFRVVYTQDKEDFLYEHGRGHLVRQEGTRILMVVYLAVIILGVSLIVAGNVMQYMPRGNDSLHSSEAQGTTEGMGEAWNNGGGAAGIQADYIIEVKETSIIFNGKIYGTVEEFEAVLKDLDRNKTVAIVDDYAISATYHQVQDLVNSYGLVCGED